MRKQFPSCHNQLTRWLIRMAPGRYGRDGDNLPGPCPKRTVMPITCHQLSSPSLPRRLYNLFVPVPTLPVPSVEFGRHRLPNFPMDTLVEPGSHCPAIMLEHLPGKDWKRRGFKPQLEITTRIVSWWCYTEGLLNEIQVQNMSELYPHDEALWTEKSVNDIHAAWQRLKNESSSGNKSWLTQMKNHYARIIRADPEAAAELLAIHEFQPRDK